MQQCPRFVQTALHLAEEIPQRGQQQADGEYAQSGDDHVVLAQRFVDFVDAKADADSASYLTDAIALVSMAGKAGFFVHIERSHVAQASPGGLFIWMASFWPFSNPRNALVSKGSGELFGLIGRRLVMWKVKRLFSVASSEISRVISAGFFRVSVLPSAALTSGFFKYGLDSIPAFDDVDAAMQGAPFAGEHDALKVGARLGDGLIAE